MSQLESFIRASHRPEISGGRLDRAHRPKFLLDYSCKKSTTVIQVNTIAFGPKQDKVLLNLEHAISSKKQILIFYYEDIHQKWTFIRSNQDCYFVCKISETQQYRIKANNLYIRGCQVDRDSKYWQILGEFYNFVDIWPGRVICAPNKQTNNESKLYQLNSSLRNASRPYKRMSIGQSYVLKGNKAFDKLPKDKSYIVKSLSGIRSIVVDDKEFKTWNQSNINNLPVLIQEKVSGNDLRVHVVNGNIYAKLSLNKSEVDYRYDDNFFSLIDYHEISDDVKQFCIDVTKHEDNSFMGIDFIQTKKGYVVLEANPSPGWSAYHECNGIENDSFIKDLLEELTHA